MFGLSAQFSVVCSIRRKERRYRYGFDDACDTASEALPLSMKCRSVRQGV
jgi:hypothetical protein